MDEPILSAEKAADPMKAYNKLSQAMDEIVSTIRSKDNTGKFLFGVFARYHNEHTKAELRGKPAEFIIEYLDVWGQDQYPFTKNLSRDLQNILPLQRGLHRLEGFNFHLKKKYDKELPFIFVSQAQGFATPGSGGINQRLPTLREAVFQKNYGAMIFSQRRKSSFLGDVSWAFYATKNSISAAEGGWKVPYKKNGKTWLEDVYKRTKAITDYLIPVFKFGAVKRIFRLARPNKSFPSDTMVNGTLYLLPENTPIFRNKRIIRHHFAGKYVLVAFNVRPRKLPYNFILDQPGKSRVTNLKLFSPSKEARVSITGQTLVSTITGVFPLIAVFDME